MPTATVYVSAENREMSRRFDTTLEHVQAAINALAVAQTLRPSTLTEVCQQTELLFLPNVRNGVISIPKEHRGLRTTPLVIAKLGEKYAMDSSFADHTPSQLQAIVQLRSSLDLPLVSAEEYMSDLDQFRESMEKENEYVPTWRLKRSMGATTQTLMLQTASTSDGKKITMMGRPIITLNNDAVTSRICPMLAHELEHEKQYCALPYYDKRTYADQTLSDELAGYDKEAEVGNALMQTGNPIYTTQALREELAIVQPVANLCDLNPISDRYAASQAVKDAIEKQGLHYVV